MMRVSSNLGILIIISDDECSYTLLYIYIRASSFSVITGFCRGSS